MAASSRDDGDPGLQREPQDYKGFPPSTIKFSSRVLGSFPSFPPGLPEGRASLDATSHSHSHSDGSPK